jgi:hypothetical protein
MKNPDNKTGDKEDRSCRIPPIDIDTPGSKLDNLNVLIKLVYAEFWA